MPLDEDKPSATQARRAKAASARLSRELEQERLRLQRAAAAAAAELEDAAAAVREATRLKAEVCPPHRRAFARACTVRLC